VTTNSAEAAALTQTEAAAYTAPIPAQSGRLDQVPTTVWYKPPAPVPIGAALLACPAPVQA